MEPCDWSRSLTGLVTLSPNIRSSHQCWINIPTVKSRLIIRGFYVVEDHCYLGLMLSPNGHAIGHCTGKTKSPASNIFSNTSFNIQLIPVIKTGMKSQHICTYFPIVIYQLFTESDGFVPDNRTHCTLSANTCMNRFYPFEYICCNTNTNTFTVI